ncbi:hypothetical protein HH212_26990 (plasmid) [Massilia forsythiae]|uniref:Uncharacterized protein n=1 Tax=Massilia forsythiae TaxID=2728020 RepID=A0A7Z2ZVQ0_9BURK|nr:hypothetical protein [Massilia forsythiae]QJE03744.1 hypothetical protein HH212_26990 [Massilia forsythiae]
MMSDDKLVEKIFQSLLDLEQQGELVLTTNFGANAARYILGSALEQLVADFGKSRSPMEATMPYLLEETIEEVKKKFDVSDGRAKEITSSYYELLRKRFPLERIAEFYWHETTGEMAKRSYYCIELGRDEAGVDYLDWRRNY